MGLWAIPEPCFLSKRIPLENGKDLGGWLRLMRARMVLGQKDQAQKALSDARGNFEGDAASLERLNKFASELGLETN